MEVWQPAVAGPASGVAAGTFVVVPGGFRAVEDLHPGDAVFDVKGRMVQVRELAPSGVGLVHELALHDRSTVRLGADQLVPVEVGNGTARQRLTLPATQIAELLGRGVAVHVARHEPLQLTGEEMLPLHPVVVGTFLADAALGRSAAITMWTSSEALRDEVADLLPPGARISDHTVRQPRCVGYPIVATDRRHGNPVLAATRSLGLQGLRSEHKHVPAVYKTAAFHDRLALVQSIFDCDGCVEPSRQVRLSTASPRMAQDLRWLIGSLGGRCSLRHRTGITYTIPASGERRPALDSYRLGAVQLAPGLTPFRRAPKVDRFRPPVRSVHWQVVAAEPAGVAPLWSLVTPSTTVLADGFIALCTPQQAVGVAVQSRAA